MTPEQIEEFVNRQKKFIKSVKKTAYSGEFKKALSIITELQQQLKTEQEKNRWLRENLIEYGRHEQGCNQAYNKKYSCRCGWNRVEQALKE
jgi:hypothetical protein